MVTNTYKTTLYFGMINNLQRRLSQLYQDIREAKRSFTGKYNCYYLVYYESFNDVSDAIRRKRN